MSSHRQIFRSSAIIGSSSIVNIIVGVVKVKVLAVYLGPVGVGLMGLFQNIMAITATLAGCGISNSGVRQLASSSENVAAFSKIRRALWFGNLILGLLGMAALWLFREPVSLLVFGSIEYANDVGWLGLGVFLTLVANSQYALLQGLRRIGDMARVTIIGSIIGASIGLLCIWVMGREGVLWFVILAPATSAAIAWKYVAHLSDSKTNLEYSELSHQWRLLMALGIPLMMSGLLSLTSQLLARSFIQHELGPEASGHFQAAWAISMNYISFVLVAMGADYYPRLSAAIQDRVQAGNLVTEQTEVALLLAGPMLMAMLTLSPWVIELLYAKSFTPASEMLRWQIMGDVIKIMSWPMGFIPVAKGRGGLFITTELCWHAVYLLIIWLCLENVGIVAAGLAYLAAYLVLLAVVWIMSSHVIGFSVATRLLKIFIFFSLAGSLILASTFISETATIATGLGLTVMTGVFSLYRVNQLIDIRGWLRRKTGMGR